jgi:hypothetical protein
MVSRSNLVLIATIHVLTLTLGANAYYVTVDAHAEECFFEKVTAGTKLGNLDVYSDLNQMLIFCSQIFRFDF